MVLFSKMFFLIVCQVFWLKITNFLKMEKLENMMEKQNILKKGRFNLLKRYLYQNRKAQNMALVAGRFVPIRPKCTIVSYNIVLNFAKIVTETCKNLNATDKL